ncbi:YraN family protein [Brevibacillus sp. SYSU BS000544]|uniref:YraN family protein n=1 Tax=Brevibacillus sp. SYSU BS000544 TaxID=3416443 RepID=UPI003CE4C885
MNQRELGQWGEEIAASYLVKKGLKIVERNVQTRYGEIDIVALDRQTLVFVEVKTRRQARYGLPVESVTRKKQQKLRELALHYLQMNKGASSFRFDVCSIVLAANQKYEIVHIPHAF